MKNQVLNQLAHLQRRQTILYGCSLGVTALNGTAVLSQVKFPAMLTTDLMLNASMLLWTGYGIYSLYYSRKLALGVTILGLIALWISNHWEKQLIPISWAVVGVFTGSIIQLSMVRKIGALISSPLTLIRLIFNRIGVEE
ncbi:hypothetical protein [Siphonobacter curvatus]|uniref:Uncharacterized protein n=1 Tax=Siphonobacter curvatus TaxID=2094562 RepID=A0A2S7IM29_9BACT|nr:hypothetical protein [Siphonobacter curvatus]PQA58678.1 hypothetical protein C5O19_03165 [Siphonobacter curvatus]